jgi:hypothetical protein
MRDRAAIALGAASRSTSGSIAILMGIMLTMLAGFAALGSEVVYAFYMQTRMESAASSAAAAGAVALAGGATKANAVLEATAVAASSGFIAGTNSATVTVNNGPASGPYAGLLTYVEVIIGQPLTLPLSTLFYAGPWQVGARAVAKAGSSGNYCVEELDRTSAGAITLQNGVTFNMPNCGMAVNSAATPALTVIGGATINAQSVSVVGTTNISGGGSINPSSGVKTNQAAVADPYSGTAVPSGTPCLYTNLQVNNGMQLNPGIYCGWGIQVLNTVSATMKPGVYILNGGAFTVGGSATLSGTGVTIVLTGSGTTWASVSVSNGAHITLSAPTTGTTAGLLFFQNPASPTTTNDQFAGTTALSLTGALYFPSQTVTYTNGVTNSASCTQLIAYRLAFNGGASFNSTCAGTGVSSIGGTPSQLVE